jgi:hypothetical protein
MGEARVTLTHYHERLGRDPEVTMRLTHPYLAYYVYGTRAEEPKDALPKELGIETEKTRSFFHAIDKSRRRVKNFHQDIMVYANQCLMAKTLREELLNTRFYNAPKFLETYWLPIEKAQNAARGGGNSGTDDARACEMVAWYHVLINGKYDLVALNKCSDKANAQVIPPCP